MGGHSGIPVTYKRLKQCFSWPGMKTSAHDYVKACGVCQQAKPDRAKYPDLLQPLPVFSQSWQVLTMDFILRDYLVLQIMIVF